MFVAKWNQSQLPDSNLKCEVEKQSKQEEVWTAGSLFKLERCSSGGLITEPLGQTNKNQRQEKVKCSLVLLIKSEKHDSTALIGKTVLWLQVFLWLT